MKITNIFKHIKTVSKHKWVVFKLCVKAGIPYRGLVHDLSKFSPVEFWESVKYYQGDRSPIVESKRVNGYSKAWLHHKGRNKHHPEYWYDNKTKMKAPVMPYKYTIEMVCDTLAAGIVYSGKNWTPSTQLEYWTREKEQSLLNPKSKEFLTEVYTQVSEKGIDTVITPDNLKKLYKMYCGSCKNEN